MKRKRLNIACIISITVFILVSMAFTTPVLADTDSTELKTTAQPAG